jgi:hypothetical protein
VAAPPEGRTRAIHDALGDVTQIIPLRSARSTLISDLLGLQVSDSLIGGDGATIEVDGESIRIEPVGGFEFKKAEIGRGWTKATGPVSYELADSYGQFAELHLCQDGIIN